MSWLIQSPPMNLNSYLNHGLCNMIHSFNKFFSDKQNWIGVCYSRKRRHELTKKIIPRVLSSIGELG